MKNLPFILLFLVIFSACTNEEKPIFSKLSTDISGIDFANNLFESDTFNILDYLYYYNGGGVAVGDLNNDELPDIFFTANQGSDRLYLNQGNLQFKDVTSESKIDSSASWSTGVSFVDINADGWQDIYVCRLGDYLHYKDHNRLYINQQDGSFTEESKKYGLDFSGFSTHSSFFDYDNDGDLDVYLLNHSIKSPEVFSNSTIRLQKDTLAGDLLLRNDNGTFIDVTSDAGIYSSSIGFGLGIVSGDINRDGWQDIYIANDFHENDYLYLNTGKGSFNEVSKDVFGHTSNFSMGVAMDDLNGDARMDLISLDMQPDQEQVYKQSGGWENLQIFKYKNSFGYHNQSPHNCVQIQTSGDSNNLYFSEQATILGIEATDWSWTPVVADFNGDLLNDVFITNGIERRPNDMDFVDYMSQSLKTDTDEELINKMPPGKVRDRLFLNAKKGFQESKILFGPKISNGAVSADFDMDGDMDLVVNHLNDKASIYINESNPVLFSRINIVGNEKNLDALGATIEVYAQGDCVYTSNNSTTTGFQSCRESVLTLQINPAQIDSVVVLYGVLDGLSKQVFTEIEENNNLILTSNLVNVKKNAATPKSSLGDIHFENAYNDQEFQPLLPYLLSTQSGKLIEGKQYSFIAQGKDSPLLLKNKLGGKDQSISSQKGDINDATFVDVNNDQLEDLYLGIGGNETVFGSLDMTDILYIQQTDGSFKQDLSSLPLFSTNTGCVSVEDINGDGHTDFFIGVQNSSGSFFPSEFSYFLINNGQGKFKKVLTDIQGLVTECRWADLDGNGLKDLVLVGHWMPITIMYQMELSRFRKDELDGTKGLWFTLELEDVNMDGQLDILAGNFGENHRLVNKNHVRLYEIENLQTKKKEAILAYTDNGIEVPYANFNMLSKKLPYIRKQIPDYKSFAESSMSAIFGSSLISNSKSIELETFSSSLFIQDKGSWNATKLPIPLQSAPIWAFDELEPGRYIAGGNFYDIDPNLGRQDGLIPISFSVTEQEIKIEQYFNLVRGEIRDIKVENDSILFTRINEAMISIPYK